MASAHIEHKLSLLPDLPGSYQMKDINGRLFMSAKPKISRIGFDPTLRVRMTEK